MKRLSLTLIFIVIVGFIVAQVPQAFSYKLQIRGNNGNVHANKKINLKISIVQNSADGNAVYIEKHQVNTSPTGMVDIEIGRGTPLLGSFQDIEWKNWPYFIKSELDLKCNDYYKILGITELLSVPFAMYAGQASNSFTGNYNDLENKPFIPANLSELNNDLGFITENEDPDPQNEIQQLVITGPLLGITKGNFINLSESGLDMDPKNEIQLISISNDTIFLSHGGYAKLPPGSSFSGDYNDLFSRPLIIKGISNMAINDLALISITSGKDNFAGGLGTLYSNTEGSNNIAIGNSSMNYNKLGNDNIANGYRSLFSNFDGDANIAMGNKSLFSNYGGNREIQSNDNELKKFGSHNIAIGDHSLYSNMHGQHNVALGFGSLWKNIGFDHISEARGSFNNAFGYRALYNNIQGSYNIANGYEALYNNTGGYNYPNDSSGNYNVAIGYKSLYSNTNGIGNIALGQLAGNGNSDGNNNIFIGVSAKPETGKLQNATAIGYNAIVNASDKMVLGNASLTSIGGYAPWTNFSDKTMKENIVYSNHLGLDFIKQLQTVTFNYTADENKRHRDGLIAQDVQNVLKKNGLHFSGLVVDNNDEKTLNLSYAEFVIPLINAIQELDKKINTEILQLEKQNQLLEKKIVELLRKLNKLEAGTDNYRKVSKEPVKEKY
jgi:trimeric autotransporter adhesin